MSDEIKQWSVHPPGVVVANQIQSADKMRSDNTLHVIGVISNPVRYHSRYRLFRQWYERMLLTPNVRVYVVELAYGDRCFEVTDAINPMHLQLRCHQELWHKENMINLAVKHLLPKDWRYMCWSDCDVFWKDPHWAKETIHQLQHYQVVQPWSTCLDMGPRGEGLRLFESFCNVVCQGVQMQTHPSQPYKYAHTGFAWACTRYFWENIKGLMDWCIVGSADHHMAWGMINKITHSVHGEMSADFKQAAFDWQAKAFKVTKGHLGYVNTHIDHHFHGSKRRRYYRERWQMFIDNKFEPSKDLMYDQQGLCKLIGKDNLVEEIRRYNRSRNEDSTDND